MLRQPSFRADIQGLRALAVSLVLLYHLWPTRLSGGYVGVDVFFVISGFLITSHLVQHPPRSTRDLAAFWGRRIRRLLPAAFVVLAATAVAARLVAPATQWRPIATEIVASALYVQNWALAGSSVDYLAADNIPTPTQHFWSLSVEEQFYLVWPLLILAVFWLAARSRIRFRPMVGTTMLLVVGASLAISIAATASEPASAFFITPTRVWELAVGGFVATLPAVTDPQRTPRLRSVVAWFGIAMIVIAAIMFTGQTPFPGSAALLPVVGTALVIVAAAGGPGSPTPLFALRPVQHVGDASYSIYLWHWPIIVLAPYVIGSIGLLAAAAIIVATIVLASITKVAVEDHFRALRSLQPLGVTYRFAAAGMVAFVVVGAVQSAEVDVHQAAAEQQVLAVEQAAGSCFGAEAIARGFAACPQDPGAEVVPDPVAAKDDRADAYRDDCWSNAPYENRTTCTYGDGPIKVALVGNSHAGQWLPALQVLARERGWTLTTYLVSQCNAMDAPLQFDTDAKTANCLAWGRWAMEQTQGDRYDLVITSERQSVPTKGESFATTGPSAVAGYRSYLQRWVHSGTNILVLHDTTYPGASGRRIPDCIAAHSNDVTVCAGTPATWSWIDPLYTAATSLGPPIHTLDMLPYLCTATTCPAVIGSVIVYFDASHMTATYARTLAPYLDSTIRDALARRP